jgi:ABC-2 type transport system permease protein
LRPATSADTRGAVNDQPINDPTVRWMRFAPGDPVLRGVNWGGLKTLYIKEVRRFFKVQTQTVWAPAVTTLL